MIERLCVAVLMCVTAAHATADVTVGQAGFDTPSSMRAVTAVTNALDAGVWFDGRIDSESWTPSVSGGNPGGHAAAINTSSPSSAAGLFQIIDDQSASGGLHLLGFDLLNENSSGPSNALELAVWGFDAGESFTFSLEGGLAGQENANLLAYENRTPADTDWATQSPLAVNLDGGYDVIVIAFAYADVETGQSDVLGIDNVTFVPSPSVAALAVLACAAGMRTARRTSR